VVDAEVDGGAQHGDRGVTVLGRPEDAGPGQLHGTIPDPAEAQIGDAVAAAGEVDG
jgi:hypothetical protein